MRRMSQGMRQNGFSPRVQSDPNVLNLTLTYAIYDGAALKIGKSDGHPQLRLSALQTANASILRLLAYTSTLSESAAHAKFALFRIRGEWFRPELDVLEEIWTWDWLDVRLWAALKRGSLE